MTLPLCLGLLARPVLVGPSFWIGSVVILRKITHLIFNLAVLQYGACPLLCSGISSFALFVHMICIFIAPETLWTMCLSPVVHAPCGFTPGPFFLCQRVPCLGGSSTWCLSLAASMVWWILLLWVLTRCASLLHPTLPWSVRMKRPWFA